MIVDNIYVQISDNKLRYIDSDMKILRDFVVDFPMKEGYVNPKYCEGQYATGSPNLYHPLIVGGRIFVQGLEFVYELVGAKVIKLFKIPDLDIIQSHSFHSKIFAFDNMLHVCNNKGQVFVFKNEKLQANLNLCFNYAFSFANRTITWSYGDKIEEVQSDGTL